VAAENEEEEGANLGNLYIKATVVKAVAFLCFKDYLIC
jgi:hypothetical protein